MKDVEAQRLKRQGEVRGWSHGQSMEMCGVLNLAFNKVNQTQEIDMQLGCLLWLNSMLRTLVNFASLLCEDPDLRCQWRVLGSYR